MTFQLKRNKLNSILTSTHYRILAFQHKFIFIGFKIVLQRHSDMPGKSFPHFSKSLAKKLCSSFGIGDLGHFCAISVQRGWIQLSKPDTFFLSSSFNVVVGNTLPIWFLN